MPTYYLNKKYGIPIHKLEQTAEQKELLKKLQREKNLERQRRYRQTESYRKSLAKHRSTKGYKEKGKAYKEKLLEHRKLNPGIKEI